MDYDNPYGNPSAYQVDNSLMRPANLPPLSMQTIGSDRGASSSGFRNNGPAYGGGGGPDRHAPRRGGYRSAPSGRTPPGRGDRGGQGNGRDYNDRSVNIYPGNSIGYHNNAPSANGGGYDRSGYGGDHHHASQPYVQGGYAGGQGNSYGRDSGFAPPRNEFDGGYDRANPSRMNDRAPAPLREKHVDERVQQERPCRILFVRNVNYTADPGRVRADFERFGEIKTFFDIIATRGMVFITYFDLRAAEKARQEMHNSLVNSRPIDVHYSLPKAEEVSGECTREKNQGSLEVALRNGRPLSVDEARRTLSSFGEIKEVRPGPSPDKKVVEFYDARRAVDAHDALNGRPHQETEMLVRFIWDFPDIAKSSVPAGAGRGRGGRGRGRGGDRGDERDRSPDHGYSRSTPYSSDRSRRRSSDAGTIASTTGAPSAPSARLDEAKKIQDLLASLSQGGLAKSSAPAPAQASFPAPTSFKPSVPHAPPSQNNRTTGYNSQTQPQSQAQSEQYPYPSAYAMPSSNAYIPPRPTINAQRPAVTPAYVPPSVPSMATRAPAPIPAYIPRTVSSNASQVPAANTAYPPAGQSRPDPAASGYGRTPLPPAPGFQRAYPSHGASAPSASSIVPPSHTSSYPYAQPPATTNGISAPPTSLNVAPSNTPSYPYVLPAPAPAPVSTTPQVAPGMSDLLALLAAQQRK